MKNVFYTFHFVLNQKGKVKFCLKYKYCALLMYFALDI